MTLYEMTKSYTYGSGCGTPSNGCGGGSVYHSGCGTPSNGCGGGSVYHSGCGSIVRRGC